MLKGLRRGDAATMRCGAKATTLCVVDDDDVEDMIRVQFAG